MKKEKLRLIILLEVTMMVFQVKRSFGECVELLNEFFYKKSAYNYKNKVKRLIGGNVWIEDNI
mgnify:CR=1 FL=1